MPPAENPRLESLDAARAFALVLGVGFHAALSFLPMFIGWAVQDVSTSRLVGVFVLVSHAFRLELFFLLAGFFAQRTVARTGVGAFLRSRAVRILVPFAAGWFVLRPLLVSGWILGAASLRGDYDIGAALVGGIKSLATLPAGLLTGSHLWFLYYLAFITALALGLRGLVHLAGVRGATAMGVADAGFAKLVRSAWRWPVFVAPTAVALWFMSHWGMDTPDQTLAPHVPVTLVYFGFFLCGWLLGRQPALLGACTRLSPALGLAALAGIVTTLLLVPFQGQSAHPRYDLARAGFVVGYALMMWALVWLTLGAFRWLYGETPSAATGRPAVRPGAWWRGATRYVADASYWLYLAHLPVVVWLQVVFAEVAWPWWVKLPLITAATLAALLLSYDWFVRPTWLGQLLNGHRRERVLFRRAVCRQAAPG